METAIISKELRRLHAISREITRAEGQLKLALDVSGLGIWIWEIKENSLHWDARMLTLFSVQAENFKPTYAFFESCVHPDDLPAVNEAVQAALKGAAYNYAFRAKDGKGGWRKIRGKGSVTFDESGEPIEMIGVCLLDEVSV